MKPPAKKKEIYTLALFGSVEVEGEYWSESFHLGDVEAAFRTKSAALLAAREIKKLLRKLPKE